MENRKKVKMCKHYKKMRTPFCHISICPKNTNSKCEVTPKKPKMRTVKGWIRITKEDPNWNKCPLRWACTRPVPEYSTPCTITYRLPKKGAK